MLSTLPCPLRGRAPTTARTFVLCTFNHTGANSVSRLHLGKGRKRFPDVFCCPEFADWGLGMVAAAPPQIKKAMPESGIQVTCHQSLIPVTIRETDPLNL